MNTTESVAAAERLDFRLCGGLRVSRGDEVLNVSQTARQGRLALAYLVVNHDRTVTREELMERVANEPDPQRMAASLSQTLSRLRKILGRERLERLPGGAVRLRGPVRVDVLHAETVLRDGRSALERGDPAQAAGAAGTVLADLAGEVLAGDEAEWLEDLRRTAAELRLEALELQAAAALRTGAWNDALTAARAAVAEGGTRQSAWGLLMQAHAGRGEIANATETFHELRRRLADEYGLTPGRDLIELHDRLVDGEAPDGPAAAAPARVPMPPALASLAGAGGGFVGRDGVLRRLRARYAMAHEGTRQLVVLGGEAGIGKTRLAAEFACEAHASGATVLYGRSDAETLVPYQPFVTAIGRYVADCADPALGRELGPELSELSRLVPGLGRRIPELREPLAVEPEMRRYRLFNAVSAVLAHVARARPAVLVLDDLQWADPSTALLLGHALHEIHDAKLLVLGTLREGEPCRAEQLGDLLSRPQPGCERITLRGLDPEEAAALVAARHGQEATGGAVGVLLEATGGNPLLLEETLKSLAESATGEGAVSAQAVRRIGVPEGARQIIRRRLERLREPTQRVLGDASVIGVEFDVRVLEAMAGTDAAGIIPALEEAEAAGLLREVPDAIDRFTFSHALVREELRERQSGARRRRLHHRIGEALEALAVAAPVHPAELAHHFTESRDPADAAKARRYSLDAGRRAMRSFAYEDAAGHLRRALALLPAGDDETRCEILLELGRAELRQGSPEARGTFAEAARLAQRLGLAELLGEAALGFASRYTEAGVVDEDGIALLRAARDALGEGRRGLRVELTARLADMLHFAPDEAEPERLSREALALAREDGDPRALAVALEARHTALLSVEHLDERLRLSQELIDLARDAEDRELEALAHHRRVYDLLGAGDVDGAACEKRALDLLAEELQQPLYEHFSVGWDVVWAHMGGAVGEIEPLAQRFHDLGVKAQARDTETIHTAQLIALRRRQERLSDFVSTVQAAVEAHPTLLTWRAVLPLAHLASGDPAAAAAGFEWFAHDRFRRVRRDMFWFPTLCVLAETCTLLRDAARARELYELLLPFRERTVVVTQAACWGSSERFLGLLAGVLGRWDVAVAHLEAAIERNDACSNRAAASLVRRDLARLLAVRRADGDLERAAELLREPLRAAEEARAGALIERVRAEVEAVERERRAVRPGSPAPAAHAVLRSTAP